MQRNQARRVDIDMGRHRSSQAVPLQPREFARLPQNDAAATSRKHLTTDLAERFDGSDSVGSFSAAIKCAAYQLHCCSNWPGHAMIDDDIGTATEQYNEEEAFPGLPTTERQAGLSAWEMQRRQQSAAQVLAPLYVH